MKNNHSQDFIHRFAAWIEHLMDLFEIGLAILVAIGFIVSLIPLVRELPLIAFSTNSGEVYHEFLEQILNLVIGIEFIKMLIKHTPGSAIEVLLFAIARHMILGGGTVVENLLGIISIGILFAIRKFLFIDSFDSLTDNGGYDWLSDWHYMRGEHKKAEADETDAPVDDTGTKWCK